MPPVMQPSHSNNSRLKEHITLLTGCTRSVARLEKEQQAARRPDNTTLLASLLTQWRAAAAQAATSPLSRFCPAFKITQLYRQLHCQTQTQQVAGAPGGKLWMMI